MYKFTLVTPQEIFFEGDVTSVVTPGAAGYFETLTGHAPIISTLQPGKVTITDSNGKKIYCQVCGGYFQMTGDEAMLLADSVTPLPFKGDRE